MQDYRKISQAKTRGLRAATTPRSALLSTLAPGTGNANRPLGQATDG